MTEIRKIEGQSIPDYFRVKADFADGFQYIEGAERYFAPYGVKECWSFKSATLEKKIDIPIDVPPPYTKKRGYLPVLRPSCYRAQRYVHVKPEVLTKDGFWR